MSMRISTCPGSGVYRVDRLMMLEQNLEVQTEIISHARAFVGTYGGLAYVGPFYGVPSISFYSTESELVPAHVDVSWRLGQAMGVPVSVIHTHMAGLLHTMLDSRCRRSMGLIGYGADERRACEQFKMQNSECRPRDTP